MIRLYPLELRRALAQIALAKLCGRLYGLGPSALIQNFLNIKTVDDNCSNYPIKHELNGTAVL